MHTFVKRDKIFFERVNHPLFGFSYELNRWLSYLNQHKLYNLLDPYAQR